MSTLCLFSNKAFLLQITQPLASYFFQKNKVINASPLTVEMIKVRYSVAILKMYFLCTTCVILVMLLDLVINAKDEKHNGRTSELQSKSLSTRRGKFWWGWGFGIGLVKFENAVCNSTSNFLGTCYTRRQCQVVSGYPAGKCAKNIAVCCVIQYSCGNTSAYNNTYFVNPNFPNTFPGGGRCAMSIKRCNADICQARIDFLSLSLAQPNANGACVVDALTITGGASQVPTICGENSGQHAYVDFNGDDYIQMVVETSATASLGRSWNFRVAQIPCASPSRAPSGCLMYYTGVTGTVQSFNYGTTASSEVTAVGTTGTRQLINNNYGVCIAMAPGYCSIQWRQTSLDSFTVSGDTEANSQILGTPQASVTGTDCMYDFVVIPNPSVNGAPANADRFCGNGFPTLTTSSKPFVLTVVTNENEVDGIANRGFSLQYTQQRCATNLLT